MATARNIANTQTRSFFIQDHPFFPLTPWICDCLGKQTAPEKISPWERKKALPFSNGRTLFSILKDGFPV